jgi:hypothetical protein
MIRKNLKKGLVNTVAAVVAVPVGCLLAYEHSEKLYGMLGILEDINAPQSARRAVERSLAQRPGVAWYIKATYDDLVNSQ